MPAPIPLAKDVQALHDAWVATSVSTYVPVPETLGVLATHGVTPAHMTEVSNLIAHAYRSVTAATEIVLTTVRRPLSVGHLAVLCVLTVDQLRDLLVDLQFTPREALAWLEAFTRTNDQTRLNEVTAFLEASDSLAKREAHARLRQMHVSLGEVAPLVFLAGMSVPEAVERQANGTLDLDSLRLLASLR